MSRRRKPRGGNNWHRDLAVRDMDWDHGAGVGRIISVPVYLPRPVAYKVRREVYPYPLPLQSQLKSRVIRRYLRRSFAPVVLTKVRIRLPRRLPLARGSYVSVHSGRINVHSKRQLARLMLRGELNRRRYEERKSNRRHARNGQLDSPGATAFGAVSEASKRGWSVKRIADSALVARAILKGRS